MSRDDQPVPCRHLRAQHQHGTHLAHDKDGCRCPECVAAARRHGKQQAYRTATGTSSYVPADRARSHVRALPDALTVGQIERRSGVNRTAIRVLIGDFPGRPPVRRITRTTEAALLAVTAQRVGDESDGLVDATGTRRRLRALVALGWPLKHLQLRLGFSTRTVWLLAGSTASDEAALVNVRTRDAVRRLYDDLSLTIPAPGRATTRARNIAGARGWPPPLAWDDDLIDDPAATPADCATTAPVIDHVAVELAVEIGGVHLNREERLLTVERLARAGLSDAEIAQRVGATAKTVLRDRQQLDVASRWQVAS